MNENPYEPPGLVQTDARSGRQRADAVRQLIGLVGFIWGMVAWSEWILREGNFGPSKMLTLLACVSGLLLIPIRSISSRRIRAALYALPAVTFVLYQFWRVV